MREERGYIGVFATKDGEQEKKEVWAPGKSFLWYAPLLSGAVSRVFTACRTHWLSLLEVNAFTGDCGILSLLTTGQAEIPSQEAKGGGGYQDMIKVRGRCLQHAHILQVCCWSPEGHYQSQGVDITMKDFSVFLDMRRCKNWAHKIFS